jgi:hypothetical protein
MSDQCGIAWPLRHVAKRGLDNCVKIGPARRKFMCTNKRGLSVLLRSLIILLSAAAGVGLTYGTEAAAQITFWSAQKPNGPCVSEVTPVVCSTHGVGLGDYNRLENHGPFRPLRGRTTIDATIIEPGRSLRWARRDANGNISRVDFFQEIESGSR